jgi:hypothetical protein
MINLEKILEDVSELDTIEAIQTLIKQGVTPEQYKAAYLESERSCHICGQSPSTLCEGCNTLACEDHYTQALCDTCMGKVNALSNIDQAKLTKKIIDNAPDQCPITGLEKCTSYDFDEGVVYVSQSAYDAYTLPEYDRDDLDFYRVRIDMDDDFMRHNEHLCDLSELLDREDFEEIKNFYAITDIEIARAGAKFGTEQ